VQRQALGEVGVDQEVHRVDQEVHRVDQEVHRVERGMESPQLSS
jgi:hypothetical protein